MSETKEYRWLPGGAGFTSRHEGQLRYRVEDGHLVYDPEPPAEAPSELSVETIIAPIDETRWMDMKSGVVLGDWQPASPSWQHDKFQRVRVRDKAADDELREQAFSVAACLSKDAEVLRVQVAKLTSERDLARKHLWTTQGEFEAANENVSRLTAERDDLSRKLAVAEGELTLVRQERDEARLSHTKANEQAYAVDDERIRRIAELERQLAEARERLQHTAAERDLAVSQKELRHKAYQEECGRANLLRAELAEVRQALANQREELVSLENRLNEQPPSCAAATPSEPDKRTDDAPNAPSSGPADEGWMEKAWLSFYVSAGWVEKDRFLAALRAHAPAARYPEVVEFLDAVGGGPWSMAAGCCEGKASYYVQSVNIDNGTWFARDTLAAACRAALDSRKELSDVD